MNLGKSQCECVSLVISGVSRLVVTKIASVHGGDVDQIASVQSVSAVSRVVIGIQIKIISDHENSCIAADRT
jgi:hypothetical protein